LNFEESGIVGGNVKSLMMLDADTAIVCELSGNVAVTDEVGTLSIYHRLAPGEGPEKRHSEQAGARHGRRDPECGKVDTYEPPYRPEDRHHIKQTADNKKTHTDGIHG